MKKIIFPRGGGKTDLLIKKSSENWHYMVVKDARAAHDVVLRAKELGVEIPLPLTYYDFMRTNYHGRGIKGLLIDNIESLLEYMARVPISAITISFEEGDVFGN